MSDMKKKELSLGELRSAHALARESIEGHRMAVDLHHRKAKHTVLEAYTKYFGKWIKALVKVQGDYCILGVDNEAEDDRILWSSGPGDVNYKTPGPYVTLFRRDSYYLTVGIRILPEPDEVDELTELNVAPDEEAEAVMQVTIGSRHYEREVIFKLDGIEGFHNTMVCILKYILKQGYPVDGDKVEQAINEVLNQREEY